MNFSSLMTRRSKSYGLNALKRQLLIQLYELNEKDINFDEKKCQFLKRAENEDGLGTHFKVSRSLFGLNLFFCGSPKF